MNKKNCMICGIIILFFILLLYLYSNNYISGKCEHFTLKVPTEYKDFTAFNPSIHFDGIYNHTLIRLSNACPMKINGFINTFILSNDIHSHILYQKMDKDLKTIIDSKIIEIDQPYATAKQNVYGLEDARIINWKNCFYLYGSFLSPPYNKINIALFKLNPDFSVNKYCIFKDKSTQKNWISLIDNDQLYFIKHIYPFELCKFTEGTEAEGTDTESDDDNNDLGKVSSVYKIDKENLDNYSEYENIRGGSPAIFFKYKNFEGYLCITHTQKFRFNYLHQFIVLSKEYPFLPIWKSKDFIIDKNGMSGIEFSSGLTQINNNEVIVTFGRFDYSPNYRIFSFEEIFKLN